ncbi:metal-dependent transcriptional regulator [Puia sp. P3]|uniref:metal-dependent transcriptional regulator n=1 Tax=Puia sp. P3 TaxID=3423952 RepID=UPI003D663E88
MISVSKENHLKAIFHLQQEKGLVTTNELAAALQTRPASVTDMLKSSKTRSCSSTSGIRVSS